MLRIILLLAAIACGTFLAAAEAQKSRTAQQQTQTAAEADNNVYLIVDEMPLFPGGDKGMRDFLQKETHWPKGVDSDVQGRVFVKFVVEKDGSVSSTSVGRSLHPALDKEAVRVIKAMPKWKPGRKNGQPARVAYTVPVAFRAL